MHELIAMTVMLCVVGLGVAVLLLCLIVLTDQTDSDSQLRRAGRAETAPAVWLVAALSRAAAAMSAALRAAAVATEVVAVVAEAWTGLSRAQHSRRDHSPAAQQYVICEHKRPCGSWRWKVEAFGGLRGPSPSIEKVPNCPPPLILRRQVPMCGDVPKASCPGVQ